MSRLSGNQIDQLGRRLRASQSPAPDDLEMLEALLNEHAVALHDVEEKLRELDLEPHGRLKTSDNIIGKLRRGHDSLRGIHDLAGTRVVHRMSLTEQDRFGERILQVCGDARLIDRRSTPSYGYRALHVVTRVDGRWVEIQLRTLYQDTWAQVMEKLGDIWGRQIRYGEEPDAPPEADQGGMSPSELVDGFVDALSKRIAEVEVDEDAGRIHQEQATIRRIVYDFREALRLPEVTPVPPLD